MKNWFVLIAILSFTTGARLEHSANAAEEASPRVSISACPDGILKFAKLSCAGVSDRTPIVEGYFYGASSLSEIEKNFPERFDKFRQSCRTKLSARQLASVPRGAAVEREAVRFIVEPVDACNGKHGYQDPCVRNEDCLENFCHPVRGTCSAVFTVPAAFGS